MLEEELILINVINGDLDKSDGGGGLALSQWCWCDSSNDHILAILMRANIQTILFNLLRLVLTLRDESLFNVESDTLAFFLP